MLRRTFLGAAATLALTAGLAYATSLSKPFMSSPASRASRRILGSSRPTFWFSNSACWTGQNLPWR
jgi:hypothetical protein